MGGLYAVAFSKAMPNILGCTSNDCKVYLWDHERGERKVVLSDHQDEVNGIDFHLEQKVIVTASDDCKAIVWDFQEGLNLRTLDKHTKPVYGCCFLGLEHQYSVATTSFDFKTRVFDMRDKQVVALLEDHSDDVIGVAYNTPLRTLATSSDDGLICLYDTATWKVREKIETRKHEGIGDNEVKRIAFAPDGTRLAAACSSGRVLVYDLTNNTAVPAQLTGHTDCVFDVTWGTCPNSNKKLLVSASHDHTCRHWREV